MDIIEQIRSLSEELLKHQYYYYVLSSPQISDKEFDRKIDQLTALEKKYPQLALENSPTKRVGSDLDNSFPEKEHSISVLSLDKEYTRDGMMKWIDKISANLGNTAGFVVEEKLDGASIVLYYRKGVLDAALTRGNGFRGNVVTENVRTIGQVPLILPEKIDIAVRGEIFIKRSEFIEFNKKFDNKYSNPRNLAAGSLRNLRSSTVAEIPLNMFAYEGYINNKKGHIEILSYLKGLSFPINNNLALFSDDKNFLSEMDKKLPGLNTGPADKLFDYISKRVGEREGLDYEIDGLVVKVNGIDQREQLGETSHHPRWAMAYKFDSPEAETVLKDIIVQIGRNGRVSPVAILEPVPIAGSIVSRATLHNQEYIDILELGKGDSVSISKRGDIIPAVERVTDKNEKDPSIYRIPANCPFCNSTLIKDGAHDFCKNISCPERIKRSVIFFVSKGQMDIDTLGEKTIELLLDKGYIRSIPDIFTFNYDELLDEEGFKEKKIENIKKSIKKSLNNDFATVFTSLGFEGIGIFAVKELIRNGFNSFDKIREAAEVGEVEVFSEINGFGDITASFLIEHFTDTNKLKLIEKLRRAGLKTSTETKKISKEDLAFAGEIWVITGSFDNFNPRGLAAKEIEKRGGKVTNTISAKTTSLLAGRSAGSKLEKARELGTKIVNEDEFIKLLKS
ncbi:MAG: NAD-dependent DNA ligase LigA [Acidobacteriota bacterium]